MGKVVKLNAMQHIYNIDNCAGCGVEIDKDFYCELGLPNWEGTQMEHIALCAKCERVAESYGPLPELKE